MNRARSELKLRDYEPTAYPPLRQRSSVARMSS
jgi:hypothetical protein